MHRILLAATALLILDAGASAREFPVRITAARVGLPAGGDEAHVSRFACWAPVYVDLEIVSAVNEPAELVIETADPDEITTTLAVPLKLADRTGAVALADLGKLAYVRPAGIGDVTLTVRTAGGGKVLSEPFRVRSLRPRDPSTYIVLSMAGKPAGFDLPKPPGVAKDISPGLRGGRVELTSILDIGQLPDRWFGYETADVVVLYTGRGARPFIDRLFGAAATPTDQVKREALVEWVRRGGRLVVAIGESAGEMTQWPALQSLLPLEVRGVQEYDRVSLYWSARESSQTNFHSGALVAKGGTFPVANLVPKPERPARILIPPPERRTDKDPVVAGQWPLGLGRVTVVGFDLDRSPFADLPQIPEFWDWVLREGGANRASAGSEGKPRAVGSNVTEEEDELSVALRTHLDTFEGVPVVSFGWIALLIVLYILLIGPVEYFFLKRVLGRLELTWITFPIIVLTVSLAAYFTASSIKGRELKVNKVDVVDVDPASGRVYGTALFTVFSPRIDNYSIGVTPGDGWTTQSEPPGTTVGWLGAPRGGRASLMRRGYRYHEGDGSVAYGLDNVPIQVWSTKSFVAQWSGTIDRDWLNPDPKDKVNRPLEHPRDPDIAYGVTGTFVNRLPVPVLSDCVVFYAGKAYPLPGGTIRAGDTIRLVFDGGVLAADWLKKEAKVNDFLAIGPVPIEQPAAAKAPVTTAPVAPGRQVPGLALLFHEGALTFGENVYPRNASLRRLDQSWRLAPDNRQEVILVGRATPPAGPAEKTLSAQESPTRLWLRGIPGAGERTSIPGTGRQETWVRIYLPVR